MEDWIQIFKTGTHTDSAGNQKNWTEEDLNRIVAQYDPKTHEAPVVIGHPQDNAPAYGWVEALKREGEFLWAKLKNLVPEFVEMVKRGLFKKRSLSLYPDLTLRHVGFLGAIPPSVKGLADIKFDAGQESITIESTPENPPKPPFGKGGTGGFDFSQADKEAQRARAKEYGIAVKDGGHVTKPGEWASVPDEDFLDPVNYRYPCPNADQTRAAAAYWGKPDNQAQYSSEEKGIINRRLAEREKKFKIGNYSENKGGQKMGVREFLKSVFTKVIDDLPEDQLPAGTGPRTFTESELKTREEAAAKKAKDEAAAEFAERTKKEKAEAEGSIRKEQAHSFCEGLKKEGKLIPAWQKMGIETFMEDLAAIPATRKFAEGGEEQTPSAWFISFLTELPKVVNFKEVATRDKDNGAGAAHEKLSALTKKKMDGDKTLSYVAAFAEVQKENPDLAREVAEELKANRHS